MLEVLKGEPKFNIVGRAKAFAAISVVAVVVSLVAALVFGLNYGVDFAGGYEIQVKFDKPVEEGTIKEILAPVGAGDARVQRFGEEEANEFLVLVREHGTITDKDKASLQNEFEALAEGTDNLAVWEVAESGETMRVGFTKPITEAQVREVLAPYNLEIRSVTRGEREDEPLYTVHLVSLAVQLERALVEGLELSEDASIVRRVDFRGPQMGQQLRNQGAMAVLYALVFILLYIGVRFDLLFAPGAVVALAHDVAITVGIFSILQIEFSLQIIAALLAIVGYSLNDTIVVYDRIRENIVRLRGRELRALVNTSINQTLSRTVLTSGTTLLVIIALLIFGGGIIRDFAVALLVGVLVGTYSSIAVAAPVYIKLKERADRKKAATNPGGGTAAAA